MTVAHRHQFGMLAASASKADELFNMGKGWPGLTERKARKSSSNVPGLPYGQTRPPYEN
jgi:hypothetical protein